MYLCQLVGDPVGDVGAGGGPGVSTENNTVREGYCHAGRRLGRRSAEKAKEGREIHRCSEATTGVSLALREGKV